jgi:hypothetical protein
VLGIIREDSPCLIVVETSRSNRMGRPLFHFSIHAVISCAPSGRFVGRREGQAPASIGGGRGAPPSRRPDYFRIDPEMELLDSRENAG